ncbi:g3957 [Coccomyxa viridis]|uniref:V-type proton ATPase subunit G n=1 Tax=Coccomyxa viridis TaxID=1274662 RepID=A0ABP1FT14_9CHLO
MQISAGQDGIQRLLKAEQEAQSIVTAARKAKSDRLKQAKQEAEKEIKAYKAQREEAFQKRMSDDSSTSGANVKRLESESAAAVKGIEKSISSKKKEVVETLLDYVTNVKFTKG